MSQPPPPSMPRPDRPSEAVIVGAFVKRERVGQVLAALPGDEVLVAVRLPRDQLDSDTFAKLRDMGALFTKASQ